MRQFFAGLPDAEAIEQDAAQDGDTVTMRFIVRGTHTAELWGITPTGNRVAWDAIMISALRRPNRRAADRRVLGRDPACARRVQPTLGRVHDDSPRQWWRVGLLEAREAVLRCSEALEELVRLVESMCARLRVHGSFESGTALERC
jgi:hypothetical protein